MKIKWGKRFAGKSINALRILVDSTHFCIYGQTPLILRWESNKFKGPGLKFEVAGCVLTGHLVREHGPFPRGSYPDLTIIRIAINSSLVAGG